MTAPAMQALAELATTATRRQLPRVVVRSVAVNNDVFANVALDCHTGDGSVPLNEALQSPSHLRDIVENRQLSGVVLSWPVQENKSMKQLSRRIMNHLDSSFSGMQHETLTTTRPFYMLDGQGRRLASMCLVKGGSKIEDVVSDDYSPSNVHTPGTW
eukprot:CAMPEP_0117030740 /NCGR_PEP_ID=MMETSP0472-20121206/22165_1 /TAXON_ID=693140 ORGANISM="Tiarina fusus, Strain LIS" /NCGR_SAMPLE_ID=MMETSP0472 /ASSEMBLY_ACC=CAM_ASM_000603 /LENGTH=156 /DNA_ID=CAMNT_0004738901 /DNA_START=141 /DNA_END=608 /DNA_ORIENTATION=-